MSSLTMTTGEDPTMRELGAVPRKRHHSWDSGMGRIQRCRRPRCDAQRRYSFGDYEYRSKRAGTGWTSVRPHCPGLPLRDR